MRRTTALIAGGGPAGSAAAIRLAQAGIAVTVIERSRVAGEGVCGGFLARDGAAALTALGVPPDRFGARPITRLRLSDGAQSTEIALPFAAFGISRGVMDAALLSQAEAEGAEILRGHNVREVDNDGLRIDSDAGEHRIAAEAVFIATGKHNLRGIDRPRAEWPGAGVGMRWTLAATPALSARLDGVIELFAFDHGYAGVLMRGDGTANLCLSVEQSRLARAGGVDALLDRIAAEQPALARYLDHERIGERNSVAAVPYGWRATSGTAGRFRLGDQAAVVASVVGDGMAIALTSGILAADAMAAGGGAAGESFQRDLAERSRRPVAIADRLRWAAEREGPRRVLLAGARWFPGMVGWAARATRIA